jgi:hypothetical protein
VHPYVFKCVDDGDQQGCGAVMKNDVQTHRQTQNHADGIALGAPDLSKGIRRNGWHCVDDGDKLGCGEVISTKNGQFRCGAAFVHLMSDTHAKFIAERRGVDAKEIIAANTVLRAQRRARILANSRADADGATETTITNEDKPGPQPKTAMARHLQLVIDWCVTNDVSDQLYADFEFASDFKECEIVPADVVDALYEKAKMLPEGTKRARKPKPIFEGAG